ncbi:MAG: DUF3108 domain-containing protein [Bacteroidales bacterium]|nr:DUF3108 domain-containing protein [Bacteroidales bacterium]
MKRFIALTFLLSLFSAVYAQENNDYPFKSGERMNFVLNYTWGGVITDVGDATCTLTYNEGKYHVLVTGKTFRFFDMFFKVRERFETRFSESTLRPTRFYREAAEGKYRMKNTLTFNKNYSVSSRTQKYDRPPYDTLLKGTANTMDMLTLLFKSRTLDFENAPVGKKYPLEFAIDKEVYNIYFIFQGRENKKIPGNGTYKTLKFAVKVVAGNVFDGKEDMNIWVTDDQNKIPVFFESPILVGRVQGRLIAVSGNKYPLTSKIK